MIQRLRDLLAHVRAGHRIGCETCGYSSGWLDAGERCVNVPGAEKPWWEVVNENQSKTNLSDWRPHTLYVADPDEPPADFGQQVFIPGPDK